MGLICTLVCFPFIFQPCVIPKASGQTQAIYYSVFAMVHCFGWASMQVNDFMKCVQNNKTKSTFFKDMPPVPDPEYDCLSKREDGSCLYQVKS